MMRNAILLLFLLFAQFGFAQIGIGTTTPTPGYALDVNGSLLIQEQFKLDAFLPETIDDEGFKFLMRLQNSVPEGEISRLDVTKVPVAPINIIKYTFTNLKRDNVRAVNLKFPADKYVVGLADFQYEGQVIQKDRKMIWPFPPRYTYPYIGNFVSRTYVGGPNGDEWHLEIQNRNRNNANDNAITYHVTLIVYDKKYFKQLSSISSNLGGNNYGEADAPAKL